jgi:hypothetical protein
MKNIIYIVCSTILLLSCSTELDIDNGGKEGNEGSIVLKMQPNNSSIQTRATEPGSDLLNENKVENMHIFFFQQIESDSEPCLQYENATGLSFDGTGVFSKDLTTLRSLFSVDVMYDVYTIVNLPDDVTIPTNITLGTIKSLRSLTPITSDSNQDNFVMDGKTSVVLNPSVSTPIVSIDMPLKRAASKIRLQLMLDASSPIAAATEAHASLKNLATVGALIDENPYELTSPDYDNTAYKAGTPASTFTFYAYENNWGITTGNETHLMVNIPYDNVSTNYYRIPINKYANNAETGRIERNMIYDLVAHIDTKGSATEDGSITINSNCIITDWTSKEVILKTINQHYLGISENDITMPNITSFTLSYVSDLPISVTNITAMCTQYSSTGTPSNVNYSSGQAQFPTFTINTAASTITINSAIPINYVPKYMTFTVTNNQGLSLDAKIVQYPVRYVTARLSSGNVKPRYYAGGRNLNLFTVNTLVPSTNGSYTLGDPTNGYALTDSTTAGNKMVSPRFIIASQYGIYTRETYIGAQTRCFLYGEDIYRSGWRLPTKAEIELVNNIQDDPNSAVKALLTGSAYWSAYKYHYYNFNSNNWTNTSASGTAFVRAVYDLYKDEQ